MTSGIKTVQTPRRICMACQNSQRVCSIVSDILNQCGYNTCTDDDNENTDFVLSVYHDKACPKDFIKNVIVFDGSSSISLDEVNAFRHKVTSYENSMAVFGENSEAVLTYSAENYSADITCRNVVQTNEFVSFDLIGGEILFRIRAKAEYSLDEILMCIAVLMATGIPLAAVVAYFNRV